MDDILKHTDGPRYVQAHLVSDRLERDEFDCEEFETTTMEFLKESQHALDILSNSLDVDKLGNTNLAAFYKSIIQILYKKLEDLSQDFLRLKQARNLNLKDWRRIHQSSPSLNESKSDILFVESAYDQSEPEVIEEYEQEYNQLMHKVDLDFEQSRGIERQMVEISELVSMFSAKIEQQQEQLDTIYEHHVHANEYVKSGENELWKTLERQANNRIVMLTFIIVATLSLWFLHWYQD